MVKSLQIFGMTCENCQKHVHDTLKSLIGVNKVIVSLKDNIATIYSDKKISNDEIKNVLGDKYSINNITKQNKGNKIIQLKPLLLVFAYLIFGTFFLSRNDFIFDKMMIDFMGLFFLTFSFFKFLDYSSFSISFSKYDPLAKRALFYAKLDPFLELFLGICFLFNWNIKICSIITLCILSITTFGVIKSLYNKSEIQCACLGTALNLPMTEATLVENIVMISMSVSFLI